MNGAPPPAFEAADALEAEPSPATPPSADGPDPSAVGRLAATVVRLREEVRAAHAAADGRALIELAKGMLVERLHCDPAQAARQLAALVGQTGRTELEVAAELVGQAARDHVTRVAADFVDRSGEPEPHDRFAVAARLRAAEGAALAAEDTQAVAVALLHNALPPLGATAVAIWTAGGDGSLTLSGYAGFSDDEAERWRYVPPGVATLARTALTEHRTVYLGSMAEGVPSIGRAHGPEGGRVALCAGTGGRIHGVLEVCWPEALAAPVPAVERQLEALAELCAHTLEANPAPHSAETGPPDAGAAELATLSDALSDAALVLTPQLDARGLLADFRVLHANARFQDPAGRPHTQLNGCLVTEAYPLETGEGDLYERLERVYATGEPFRAAGTTLRTLVDKVPLTTLADISISRHGRALLVIWNVADDAARLATLLQHAQRLGRLGGFEENLATGEITWSGELFGFYGRRTPDGPVSLHDLPEHAHPDDAPGIDRFLRGLLYHRRAASVDFRLQRADGNTRHLRIIAEPVLGPEGGLRLVRGAYQDVSSQHWTEVALAATRDQLAQSEQEAAERARLTLQLQHAIMPPAGRRLSAPGMDVAVRYRPAESAASVGGDWYDAFVLPDGQVLLCVGDVAGHGVEAATAMVVLRNALRGLAMTGADPGQLLSWLNSVAFHLTDHVTATAVCAVYDPCTRRLRWARAGHLPPVLVRSDSARSLPMIRGLLLGAVPETDYEECDVELHSGDTVLMFTDGLIERRDTAVQDSIDQLLSSARTPAETLEHRLDRLLTHSKSDTDDDTCLIGIQTTR
jgi:serine phosphatase RsbU (regulator of sigma subunit)